MTKLWTITLLHKTTSMLVTETECVGDNIDVSATDLTDFVINILYLLTFALDISVQKSDKHNKNIANDVTDITLLPKSLFSFS